MSIAFRAATSVNVQATSVACAIPGTAQVGDTAYALLQTGSIGGTPGLPSGWTLLGNLNSSTTWYAQLVKKVLTVSDLGASVSWATPGSGVKSGVLMVVYSGVDTGSDYDDIDFSLTASSTTHLTGSVLPTQAGDWVVGMYLERGTSPVVTPPGAFTLRASCTQTGGASIVGSVVDSGGSVSTTTQDAGTFTSTLTNGNGVTATIAVKGASTTISASAVEAFDSFASGLANGSFNIASDTYTMILMDPGYVYNKTGHVYYGDVSADECATSNGYTNGGETMTGVGLVLDAANHRYVWDADPVEWVASGGNLPSTIGAIIFKDTGTPATSRLVWWADAGGTISSASVGLTATPDPDEGWGYIETPVA